jgi:zinc protease
MASVPAAAAELAARKSVLIGDFGRDMGATDGLAGVLGGLAVAGIDLGEMNVFTSKVEAVTAGEVTAFAADVFDPARASVIIVGDARLFGEAIKTAVPGAVVIPLGELDLDSPTLRKGQ